MNKNYIYNSYERVKYKDDYQDLGFEESMLFFYKFRN